MITAIETQYKGYRFRSRLEARWAVFFDALNIKWQYEQEGYNLNGIMYLPDFYLNDAMCYAEVKPYGLSDDEIVKINSLALESGKKVILLVGVPDDTKYLVAEPHDTAEIFGSQDELIRIISDPCNYIILSSNKRRCLFYSENGADSRKDVSGSRTPHNDFKRAVISSRSARFEHGESAHA